MEFESTFISSLLEDRKILMKLEPEMADLRTRLSSAESRIEIARKALVKISGDTELLRGHYAQVSAVHSCATFALREIEEMP